MKTISIDKARDTLGRLVECADLAKEIIVLTKKGTPRAKIVALTTEDIIALDKLKKDDKL